MTEPIVTLAPAVTGPDAPVPYEKVDRTPSALQHLEGLLIGYLGLDSRWLVSLLGSIQDKGSVALFGELLHIGHPEFRLYRVVSFDGRTQRFTHASRHERADAERLYDQRVEELS
jgi:hypothetical protein